MLRRKYFGVVEVRVRMATQMAKSPGNEMEATMKRLARLVVSLNNVPASELSKHP